MFLDDCKDSMDYYDKDTDQKWQDAHIAERTRFHKEHFSNWYESLNTLMWNQHKKHPCTIRNKASGQNTFYEYDPFDLSISVSCIKDVPEECPYVLEHTLHAK